MTSRSIHFVISADGKILKDAVGSSVAEIDKLNKAAEKMAEKLGKADGGARAMAVLEAAIKQTGGAANLTAEQISMVAERIGRLKSIGATVPPELAKIKAQMDATAASARAMGAAHDELSGRAQGLASSMGPLGGVLSALGPAGLAAAAGIGAVAVAGGAVLGVLEKSVGKAIAFSGSMQEMSDNTGVAASKLSLIAGASGIGVEGLETFADGLKKLDKALVAAGSTDKFKQLGLSVKELIAMNPEERFAATAEAILKLDNATQIDAASQELLGKKMPIALLRDYADITEKMGRAGKLGLGIDDSDASKAKALSDELKVLSASWEHLFINLGNAIITTPGVQDAITGVTDAIGKLSKVVKDNKEGIQGGVSAVADLGTVAFRILSAEIQGALDKFGKLKDFAGKVTGASEPGGGGLGKYAVGAGVILGNMASAGLGTHLLGDFVAGSSAAGAGGGMVGPPVPSVLGPEPPAAGGNKPSWLTGDQEEALKRAKAAAEALAKTVKDLGDQFMGLGNGAKNLSTIEAALGKIGGAGNVARDQLEGVGKELLAAAQSGIKLGANSDALLQRYLGQKQAAEDAAAATKFLATEQSELERVSRILGPTAQDVAVSLSDLMKAAAGEGEGVDLAGMGSARLVEYTKRLQALAVQAATTGHTVKGLDVAMGAAFGEAGKRDDATIGGLYVQPGHGISREGLEDTAGVKKNGELGKTASEAADALDDFRKSVGSAGNVLEHLGQSIGGKAGGLLQALGGIAGAYASSNYGSALSKNGGTTGDKINAGVGALGAVGDIYQANKHNMSAAGGAASGAASGAKAGAAFGPYGVVIGGIVGGLVGLFSGSKFRGMAKEAGKVLGVEMTKELAEAIDATKNKLHVSTEAASLLNISGAMGDKDPRLMGANVIKLVEGIKAGTIPAKEGLEELAKDFGSIADAALKAGSVGDKALVGIIKRARELGLESPEIKEFVKGQLLGAAGGVDKFVGKFSEDKGDGGKLIGGLDLFGGATGAGGMEAATANGKAQATIFSAVFWANVKEQGLVGAADAMKESFGRLKENLSTVFGADQMQKIFGDVEAMMGLAGNELFRGAAEGAQGLKEALEGVANAGYLTTDSFGAFEQQAGAAFAQAVAGGASSQQALLTIAPLLQSLSSASENYGINLDDATKALIEQAKAAGIAFKTDPTERLTASIDALTVALGGVPPKIDDIGQSLRNLPPMPGGPPSTGGGGPTPPPYDGERADGGWTMPSSGGQGRIIRVAENEPEFTGTAAQWRQQQDGGGAGASMSWGDIHIYGAPTDSPEDFAAKILMAVRNDIGGVGQLIQGR